MARVLRTGGIPEATYLPFGLASYGNVSQAVMCVKVLAAPLNSDFDRG